MQPPGEPVPLPPLRQDLQLLEGAHTITGRPTWLIFDPVRHSYFQVDQRSYRLLCLWHECRDSQELLAKASAREGVHDAGQTLAELLLFIEQNHLVLEAANGWRHYAESAARQKRSWASWFVHSYLFFRIPLVRPHRFLRRVVPWIAPLFSWPTFILLSVLGLLGIYLTARQWDEFTNTFPDFFNVEGILFYLLVLIGIKIVHELAHALTAAHFGCRVPTMGVAFLVMFPVLYTDVTDAWRLQSRRQRILIGAAGMIAELVLAALATFAWAFLPVGTAKSLAFVVATLSWVLSLAINLNPLMRFDGYYLLSDALGIENLQSRAFALGRWKLREWLFGLGLEPPERLPHGMTGTLIAFAWATWVYRFFLFIGIALLVYYLFFKVLGLLLFVIEIIWFIGRPVWSEIKEWIAMRNELIRSPRAYVSATVAVAAAVLCIIPWTTSVDVPAVIETRTYERLHPVAAARIESVSARPGQQVSEGQVLLTLHAPDLEKELKITRTRLQLVEQRQIRAVADNKDRAQVIVLERERQLLLDQVAGLQARLNQLVLRAPFAGRLVDLAPNLHIGRWVARDEVLMTVVDDTGYVARGYLAESDLWRINSGAEGTFVPDDVQRSSVPIIARDIAIANSPVLDISYLASHYGGPIAVHVNVEEGVVPLESQYLVTLDLPEHDIPGLPVQRGLVKLEGKPESILARVWRRTLQVLVRESGA